MIRYFGIAGVALLFFLVVYFNTDNIPKGENLGNIIKEREDNSDGEMNQKLSLKMISKKDKTYLLKNNENLENNKKIDDLIISLDEASDESIENLLKELRKEPEISFNRLRNLYENINVMDHDQRMKIIWTVGELNYPKTDDFLRDVAISSPSSLYDDVYKKNSNNQKFETIIRANAVGGLFKNSLNGSINSRDFLLETIEGVSEKTVQRLAIKNYLATSKNLESDIGYLKSVLPEKDHQYITYKFSSPVNIE